MREAIRESLRHTNALLEENEEVWDATQVLSAQIWMELLRQSDQYMIDDIAPHRLAADLQAPLGFSKLGNRRWDQVRRLLRTEIKPYLKSALDYSNLPMLHEARLSNGKGGYHEKSGAEYYLSFDEGEAIPVRSKKQQVLDDEKATDRVLLNTGEESIGSPKVNKDVEDVAIDLHRITEIYFANQSSARVLTLIAIVLLVIHISSIAVSDLESNNFTGISVFFSYISEVYAILQAIAGALDDSVFLMGFPFH